MVKRLYNNKGFTLIEVLVSIMLIGVMAVTLMGLFTTSLQNNIASKNKMEKAVLAKNMMEKIKVQISSSNIESFKDLNSIAEYMENQYDNTKVIIREKSSAKNLYEIQIDVSGVKKGTKETFISHIYVPYGGDE